MPHSSTRALVCPLAVLLTLGAGVLVACTPDAPPKESSGGDDGSGGGPGCATALLFVDADEDGYGDGAQPEEACVNVPGHAEQAGDCDDSNPAVNPGVTESCNGIDDDCDGTVDRGLLVDVWTDGDGDGFGDPDSYEQVCVAEPQHVRDDTDCDDTDGAVFPGAEEVCNGIDDDCDEGVDDDAVDRLSVFADVDGDGLGAPGEAFLACPEEEGIADNDWDCDDMDPATPVVVDSGAAGTGTLADPLGTLQAGIDAAVAHTGQGCVVALPGLYLEALDLSAGEVEVVGVEGAERTVVDAIGLDAPVLTLGAGNLADTRVEGLRLTGGTAHRRTLQLTITGQRYDNVFDDGAGVYAVDAVASLVDVVIADNRILDPELSDYTDSSGRTVRVSWAGRGGGVFVSGGSLSLERVVLEGNEASDGGALFAEGSVSLLHSSLVANEADKGGALSVDGGALSASNSIFAGNRATTGASLHAVDGEVDLEFLTVHEDGVDGASGALLELTDCRGSWLNLILSAPAPVGVRSSGTSGDITVDGLLFHQPDTSWEREVREGLEMVNELSGDPQFTGITEDGNPTNDDLHLEPTSPAVDAASAGADADGSPADLGAYGGPRSEW